MVFYILPYGQLFIGLTWFDWFRSEDGPLEWLQFSEYLTASFLLFIFLRSSRKSSINTFLWLVFFVCLFLIAGEEISWGERILDLESFNF